MEHEMYPDGFLEAMRSSRSAPPSEPLFEEQDDDEPEEDPAPLEGRLEALEYRLGRALLCLDRCQKEQAELHRRCRELAREQQTCQERQERHRTVTKYGMYAVTGLVFAALAKDLAPLGWKLFDGLASLLSIEPTMAAGVLLAGVLLWLLFRLGRTLVRKLLSRRGKGDDDHAVCDR